MDSRHNFTNASQNDLKEDHLFKLKCLKQLVNLMNDIYLSAWKNYGTAKRIYPHRQLCMGTLIVARHNTDATINLIEANLVDQVHYISRNIWELTINLYYILDDETERDARLERYRRYSDEILPFKILQLAKKYPEEFKGQIAEGQAEVKEKRYKCFLERYRNASGRELNINSWNGMTLDRMIDGLHDEKLKKEFMTLYDFLVKTNNYYLHPSWYYLKNAAVGTTEANRDYQSSIDLMTRVFSAAQKITMKFLDNFPKGRPEFQARLTEINGWFRSKKNPTEKAENT